MEIMIWISLVLSLAAIGLAVFSYWSYQQSHRFLKKLFTDSGHENFGEVLISHQRLIKQGLADIESIRQEFNKAQKDALSTLSRVGLVKYNPFNDSGGNMSFSYALLNGHGDGVIITSLHSRQGMRLYVKKIEAGKSEQSLTPEEQQALDIAFE